MKVVGLISGGKDGCYNILHAIAHGHEVIALANLYPQVKKDHLSSEIDSYMYQTVGYEMIDSIAECMNMSVYRKEIEGESKNIEMEYQKTEKDEVEDLYQLVRDIQMQHPNLEGVSVGAIASQYQTQRVEDVCRRLHLVPLTYLWQRNQEELLQEMIEDGMHCILIKVASMGLSPEKHLGQTIDTLQPHLIGMKKKYGLHVCGEGGEYETLTLDCPLFYQRIVVDEWSIHFHSKDPYSPVGLILFKKWHLEPKNKEERERYFNQVLRRIRQRHEARTGDPS